jgi:hypothetical protein
MNAMMKSGPAPSRQGKKQIIGFIEPSLVDAFHAKARAEGKTNQELLGEALNAAFAKFGRRPVIETGHSRVVRRIKKRSMIRTEENAPPCRTGRRSIGGWFDGQIHDRVTAFAAEVGLGMQAVIELGVQELLSRSGAAQKAA